MQVNRVNVALGRKVADLRKSHGWSQALLAEMLGEALGRTMDATTVTRMEQGKRPFAVHELFVLGPILGIEPAVFLQFYGPLDLAFHAVQRRLRAAETGKNSAEAEWRNAVSELEAIEALQHFRVSHREADLKRGLAIAGIADPLDLRELLMDSGVSAESFDAALVDVDGEISQRLCDALLIHESERRKADDHGQH